MQSKVIGTWKDAQAIVPAVLPRLNSDPALLLAAAANPILALQSLGYDIAPSFLEEFADRLRFGARGAVRIRQLREEIYAVAGGAFDLTSPRDVEHVLFDRLKLSRPPYSLASDALRPPDFSIVHDAKDPLEPLRGQHPLVDALLEFRRLNAHAPGFAPPDLFEEIRAGKHQTPIVRLHARLKTTERNG